MSGLPLLHRYIHDISRSFRSLYPLPQTKISTISSMSVATEFAQANKSYVSSFGNKGSLPLPPSRKVAIVTCMDARIDPAASLGLKEGEAHVIRNAGGRASEALRSIIISQQLLGTREVVLFHHTDCGMLTFKDEDIRSKIKASVDPSVLPAVASTIDGTPFLPFGDLNASVKEDIAFLKANPLILAEVKEKITGWIYEVESGKIVQVA